VKKIVIGTIVLIVIILAVFALMHKPYRPAISPTAAAVEDEAINLVQQEIEQAIANITEEDIENALTQ
jgi:uncharacterized protein YpmB